MACGDGDDDNAELDMVLKAIANNTGCTTCGSDDVFAPASGKWSHSCQDPDEGNKLSDVPSGALLQRVGKVPYRIP